MSNVIFSFLKVFCHSKPLKSDVFFELIMHLADGIPLFLLSENGIHLLILFIIDMSGNPINYCHCLSKIFYLTHSPHSVGSLIFFQVNPTIYLLIFFPTSTFVFCMSQLGKYNGWKILLGDTLTHCRWIPAAIALWDTTARYIGSVKFCLRFSIWPVFRVAESVSDREASWLQWLDATKGTEVKQLAVWPPRSTMVRVWEAVTWSLNSMHLFCQFVTGWVQSTCICDTDVTVIRETRTLQYQMAYLLHQCCAPTPAEILNAYQSRRTRSRSFCDQAIPDSLDLFLTDPVKYTISVNGLQQDLTTILSPPLVRPK